MLHFRMNMNIRVLLGKKEEGLISISNTSSASKRGASDKALGQCRNRAHIEGHEI